MRECPVPWTGVSFEGKPAERKLRRTAASRVRGAAVPPARVRAAAASPPTSAALDPLAARILELAGLDAAAYRSEPLNRRVSACVRAVRAASAQEALDRLTATPSLLPQALDALLLGVTCFQRDASVFASLAQVAPPALRQGPLRVWSVGCSDGAELYSAALLLADAGLLARSSLLGTDCRETALARARAAWYAADSLREVPAELVERYFEVRDASFRPVEALRRSARWVHADVTRRVEGGPWHLIFCRNVAIYLAPTAGDRLWQQLTAALAPGGFLVTGKAESRLDGLSRVSRSLYQKPWKL